MPDLGQVLLDGWRTSCCCPRTRCGRGTSASGRWGSPPRRAVCLALSGSYGYGSFFCEPTMPGGSTWRQRRAHRRAAEHLDDVGAVDRVRDRLADLDVLHRLVVVRRARCCRRGTGLDAFVGPRLRFGSFAATSPGTCDGGGADVELHVGVRRAGLQLLLDRLLALRLVDDDLVDVRACGSGRSPAFHAGLRDSSIRFVGSYASTLYGPSDDQVLAELGAARQVVEVLDRGRREGRQRQHVGEVRGGRVEREHDRAVVLRDDAGQRGPLDVLLDRRRRPGPPWRTRRRTA